MHLTNTEPFPENFLAIAEFPLLLSEEQLARVFDVINDRTKKQQRAFRKYFCDHKTIGQIAAEDGVTYNNIRTRIETTIMYIRWNRWYILFGDIERKK